MDQKFEIGEIFAEVRRVFDEHRNFVVTVVLAIAVPLSVLDFVSDKAGNFTGIVVGVFAQYLFLERILADRIAPGAAASGRRYGALFGAGILGGLGIVVGFICLIVPGIFLMAQWSLSSPFVVAERRGPIEALSASWRATVPSIIPIMIVQLLLIMGFVVLGAGPIGLAAVTGSDDSISAIVLMNLAVAIFYVGQWMFSAAIYRLVRPSRTALVEVFG